MKLVELNFGFITHIQWFEISWCPALSHTADDRWTTEHQQILKSYSSREKKLFLKLVLQHWRLRNLLHEGKRAPSEWAGWLVSFKILAALLLSAVVGRLLCSLHFPFQQLSLCSSAGNDVGAEGTLCTSGKEVQDWAPNMSQHPEKWRYWQSLFTSCLEKVVWKRSHGL